MSLLNSAPNWLAILLSLVLLAAAAQDIIVRKISNYLVLGVILLGIVAVAVVGPVVALWQNAALFILALGIGMAVYSSGILGAGDVKLLSAVILWSDLKGAPRLIAAVFIAGGIIAVVMLLRLILNRTPAGERLQQRRSVPYAVAVAGGALLIIWYGRPLGF